MSSREKARHDHPLRLHRQRHSRQARQPRSVQRQGAARRQHRKRMRIHAAIQGARSAVRKVSRERARSARLSMQSVRPSGAGRRSGDRAILRSELRREVSDVRQGGRQRRSGIARLSLSEVGEARPPRHRGDQMEFHQIPGRPRRQRRCALCTERHAGIDRTRDRTGAVIRTIRSALCIAALGALVASGALAQPDGDKVLRVAFPIAETGFDPQCGGDAYSNYVNRQIFDPLYKYEYLPRPYKLVPNAAAALPEISADGKTWTIRVRPGIYFADDPAFKAKRRELTAADYVYSLKRLLDPKMRSNFLQIVEGRFVGAEAVVEKARSGGDLDYDAPIEGLQAIDRYTLRFKLNFPDYEL